MKLRKRSLLLLFSITYLYIASYSPAQNDIITWPRIFKGRICGKEKMIYADSCDFSVPAFADIDGDGDADMLMGRATGHPLFFRNDGSPNFPEWSLQPEGLKLPPLSSPPGRTAPFFSDFDNDGDADLSLGLANGCVACYCNIGNDMFPEWELTTENWTGDPVTGNARPILLDIDADGDKDLFIGSSDGKIAYYRNEADPGNSPEWVWQLDNYMNIDAGADASPYFCDLDGDGLHDLLVGAGDGHVEYYRGYGTPELLFFTREEGKFSDSSLRKNAAPVLYDINSDGLQDFFLGSFAGNVRMNLNDGTATHPLWEENGFVINGLDTGSESFPSFCDIDLDGDPDLFISSYNASAESEWSIHFYRNVGTPWLPEWKLETDFFAGISCDYPSPVFSDLDGEGDSDMLVGDAGGLIRYYENTSSASSFHFERRPAREWSVPGGWARPCVCDADGDGDVDFYVAFTDISSGSLFYYENDGSPENFRLSSPVDLTEQILPGLFPSVSAGNLNNDNIPDLLVGNGQGEVRIFPGTEPLSGDAFSTASLFQCRNSIPGITTAIIDINGDLKDDLILGNTYGGILVFENPSESAVIKPHHSTILTGESLHFITSPPAAGSWSLVRNASNGYIDGESGDYTGGDSPGVDIILFEEENGITGAAYVNVISPEDQTRVGKAVILAGRKPNDSLWETTNNIANYCYRTLRGVGYSKENIYYMNPVPGQDVDGNGNFSDDIDAESSLSAVDSALTDFSTDASSLFIFMVDHGFANTGGELGRIQCNETEMLYASRVDEYLDELQKDEGVTTITLVTECCHAGAFLRECGDAAEEYSRIVISSTGTDQASVLSGNGLISFSWNFLNDLHGLHSVGESFSRAASGMSRFQSAGMDDTGDGKYMPELDGDIAGKVFPGAEKSSGASSSPRTVHFSQRDARRKVRRGPAW